MKIGLIADALDSKITGISSYNYNLITTLLKLDTVNEYFLIHYSSNPLPFKGGNINVLVIPTPFFDPHRTITRTYSFMNILNKYNLDMLHDLIGSALWFSDKQINIQSIFDASCFTIPKFHTFINRMINSNLLKKSIKSVDHVITTSYASKYDIIRYLHVPKDKISVTYLAADRKRFYKYSNDAEIQKAADALKTYNIKQPFLLSVGALVARKNIITLIKSFKYLKEKYHIPHKLVLTGVRPVRSKQLSEDFDSYPDIIFTGYVQDDDLPSLYNSADCFVFPSLYEGFGLPVLEAMQCGCPVIVSNNSSLPEITGDCALLLNNPLSVEELSQQILNVINDKKVSHAMTENGLIQAKKFSWAKCAQETLQVYNSLR